MKKVLALVLSALLGLSVFTGCSENKPTENSNSGSTPATQTTAVENTLPTTSPEYLEYTLLNNNEIAITDLKDFFMGEDLIIPETIDGYTVTTIGSCSFVENNYLKSITLPKTITKIESYAFDSCENLTQINVDNAEDIIFENRSIGSELPNLVESNDNYDYYIIGGKAQITRAKNLEGAVVIPDNFEGCPIDSINASAFQEQKKITSIVIPDSVKHIESEAFYKCKNLENVVLPKSLESIGDYAFSSCKKLRTINFPEALTTIGEGAFSSCKKLENFKLPNSLKEIGNEAFELCETLTNVTIPESVTTLGDMIFCQCKSLKKYSIPKKFDLIASSIFYNCKKLTKTSGDFDYIVHNNKAHIVDCNNKISNIVVPKTLDGYTVEALGPYIFCYQYHLYTIVLPDSIKYIGDHAFTGCKRLKKINLPKELSIIGPSALCGCTLVKLDKLPEKLTSIGDSAFSGCDLTITSIPKTVTEIGSYAFHECNIKNLTIEGPITNINSYTFTDCKKLEKIVLPDTVTEIYDSAFRGCSSLKEINIPEGILKLPESAFSSCKNLEKIVLPQSLKEIRFEAFSNCKSLKEINVPSDIILGKYVFYNCKNYLKKYGDISYYTNRGKAYIVSCKKSAKGDIVIPEKLDDCTVTEIESHAFYGCEKITSIKLPEGLRNIKEYAFSNLNITNIDVPSTVIEISNCAFNMCKKLKSATLPKDLEYMGTGVFSYCYSLKEIKIPNTIKYLIYGEFYSCTNLKSVTLPDNLTSIGSYTFSKCKKLKEIYIPDSVTFIDVDAFKYQEDITIKCSENSYAKQFAVENNIKYEIV